MKIISDGKPHLEKELGAPNKELSTPKWVNKKQCFDLDFKISLKVLFQTNTIMMQYKIY